MQHTFKAIGHFLIPGRKGASYRREVEGLNQHECAVFVVRHARAEHRSNGKFVIIGMWIDGKTVPEIVVIDKVHMGIDGWL
jgi:hypothetical protein